MRSFSIYFGDLEEDAQIELCKAFQTTPEEENWDSFLLTVIEREEKGEEDENEDTSIARSS